VKGGSWQGCSTQGRQWQAHDDVKRHWAAIVSAREKDTAYP